MSPKLLDTIKESGLSHEEVKELIKKHLSKPDSEEEENQEEDMKTEETDKPKDKTIEKKVEEKPKEKKEKPISYSKEELAKIIQKALEKERKHTLKKGSKGKVTKRTTIQSPSLIYDMNIRGYEVKTIREKK